MLQIKKHILASGLVVFTALLARSQTPVFLPGNLAVLRCGDGTEVLTNGGNTVFIDQYNPDGTNPGPVTSITLPNSGLTSLILDGTAGSEGGLTRSLDRTVLALTGYNTNLNSPYTISQGGLGSTSGKKVPRAIVTIDAFGALQQKADANAFSSQNTRFVATDGTNNFWAVGGGDGVDYFNAASFTTTFTIINSSVVNNRAIRIVGGSLYFSSQKSSPVGLYGLNPAALSSAEAPGPVTNLVVGIGSSSSIDDFAMNPAGTVVYVADTKLGIQKWVNPAAPSGSWSLAYTFPLAAGAQSPGAFGVLADFSGTNPVVYATTTETNGASQGNTAGNHLARIVDTNSSAVVTYLAQASTNEVLKGIDFAPNLLPYILAQPQSQAVTNGTPNVGMAVAATSPFTLSYQWQLNGAKVTDDANVTGSATAGLNFATAFPTNQGNYAVVITNQYGAVTSIVATLTVNTAVRPAITTQPAAQTNFVGGLASFTVVATGTPSPAYQWSVIVAGVTNALVDGGPLPNGETISGSTNATLLIANVQTNDAGQYFITVTNTAGATNSQAAQLTVVPVPPEILSEPDSQTNVTGGAVSFKVKTGGTDPVYRWSQVVDGVTNVLNDGPGPSGEILSGAATTNLVIANLQAGDAGLYFLTVTNSVGATNSGSASLIVIGLPPPSSISYSSPGMVYTQSFDSLPDLGGDYTATVAADNPVTIDGVTYSFGDTPALLADFAAPIVPVKNLPGGLGLSNTMSGWYGWVQGGNFLGANCGDITTGGLQDFGSTNDLAAGANRALGLITTGSAAPAAFAARFVNHTATTLTNMNLQFTGELWRQSDVPKTLAFYYVIDATGTNSFDTNAADFVFLNNLNVTFPTDAHDDGGTNVDGTLPINQVGISVTNQLIANWPPGAALWLAWEMTDPTGKAQGIGIDNLGFSAGNAVAAPIPPLAVTPGSVQVTGSGAFASASFSFTNAPGLSFSILATNNLAAPVGNWPLAGVAVENPSGSGHYQFTDPAPVTNSTRYYRLRQP